MEGARHGMVTDPLKPKGRRVAVQGVQTWTGGYQSQRPPHVPLSQQVEESGSEPVQCGSESHGGHAKSSTPLAQLVEAFG